MRMIECHYSNNHNSIWINVDRIISIERVVSRNKDMKSYTEIDCDDDACYMVEETPQDIAKAIGFLVIIPNNNQSQIYKEKENNVGSPKLPKKRIFKKRLPRWNKKPQIENPS